MKIDYKSKTISKPFYGILFILFWSSIFIIPQILLFSGCITLPDSTSIIVDSGCLFLGTIIVGTISFAVLGATYMFLCFTLILPTLSLFGRTDLWEGCFNPFSERKNN